MPQPAAKQATLSTTKSAESLTSDDESCDGNHLGGSEPRVALLLEAKAAVLL